MAFTLLIRRRGVKLYRQTLAEISRAYTGVADELDEGFSTFPDGTVLAGRNGKVIGKITCNGHIWAPGKVGPGYTPIYDPSASDAL